MCNSVFRYKSYFYIYTYCVVIALAKLEYIFIHFWFSLFFLHMHWVLLPFSFLFVSAWKTDRQSFLFCPMWIRIRFDFGRLNPDPHWECGLRYGSRWEKLTTKKWRKCIVQVILWCLEASPVQFSSLDVLHGGLGRNIFSLLS